MGQRQHIEPRQLWHATDRANLQSILSGGLRPGSFWGTVEIADYFAEDLLDRGKDPVYLVVDIDRFDPEHLAPDRPGLQEPLTFTLGRCEEDIQADWRASSRDWRSSFKIVGSVFYAAKIGIRSEDVREPPPRPAIDPGPAPEPDP